MFLCACVFAHSMMKITTLGPFRLQVPRCLFRRQRVCVVQRDECTHCIILKKKKERER